jgi:epoxide hydrolase 4
MAGENVAENARRTMAASAPAAEPWHFETHQLPSGLKMRIARAGAGPLIIMLHGFPECWYSWRNQLREFSSSFDCIAPELRGYGETDAPVGVHHYAIEKLVDDVAGLVEALGCKRAIIVGHDWGGAIAWATAMMKPQIVERLIVMNCPHPKKFREHLRSNPRQMLRSWYMFFFQLPWIPEAMLRAGGFAAMTRAIHNSAVNKYAFSDADLDVFREAFKRPYAITAAINYYRALARGGFVRTPAANHWINRKIDAPTLLIWGEEDFALGKELTFDMRDLFNGPLQIKYVPGSGHWVQQERPEAVNRYMHEFLVDLV